MKLVGIYKITSPSGRIYIGQSIDIDRRFNYYKNLSCKEQPKLYNSLTKYGVDAHIFEILEYCEQPELNTLERKYQHLFNSVETGLNLMYVRDEYFNGNHSQETKDKISKGLKGKPAHPNTVKRLIEYNKTRVLSQESRDKMSKSLTGKKHSIETINAQIKRQLGTKRSEETKRKMAEVSPNKKAVIQYDLEMNFIAEHPSVRQANRNLVLKLTTTTIYQCIAGDTKTAYGYIWRYKKH